MAVVENTRYTYTGDGVTREFPVVFKHLRDSDVEVLVDGVSKSYTYTQGSNFVKVQTAPAVGAEVEILRNTDARAPLHEFQRGSPLVPEYLDENFKQVLYTVSESAGDAAQAEAAARIAEAAATAAAQASAQAELAAHEATGKADDAHDRADAAYSLAESAGQTADSAVQVAEQAQEDATAAGNVAASAVGNSLTAQMEASAARSAAEDALNQIEDAVSGAVVSFNGRTGAVVPASGDYAVEDITGLSDALQNVDADITVVDEFGSSSEYVASQALVTNAIRPRSYPGGVDTGIPGSEKGGVWDVSRRSGVSSFPGNSGGFILWDYPTVSEKVQIAFQNDTPGGTGVMTGVNTLWARTHYAQEWSEWEAFLNTGDLWNWRDLLRPEPVNKDLGGNKLLVASDVSKLVINNDPHGGLLYNHSHNSTTARHWQVHSGTIANTATSSSKYTMWNRTEVAVTVRFLIGPGTFGLEMCPPHHAANNDEHYQPICQYMIPAGGMQTVEQVFQPGEYFRFNPRPASSLQLVIIKYAESTPAGYDLPADPFTRV